MPEAAWKPKVEKRRHPFGEQGVNHSLEQVAKKAAEGSSDWRVRRYVGDVLKNAGIRKATNDRQIAVALLKAVQQKTWMPDPVGTEWMPGAHLMTCVDKDTPCFHGGDCDDLSILLGACLLCAGIHTIIVGHAYNKRKQIQHVLCAARIDGEWLYADPSTDMPLGKCVKFTRERWLSVPNVKVICDNNVCSTDLKGYDPVKNNFVTEGTFVSVDGIPRQVVEWEPAPPVIQWLGAEQQAQGADDAAYAAAEEEARKRNYGTSEDDLKAYAAAAGCAGATAACAAYPATSALATTGVCCSVGGAIAAAVMSFAINTWNAITDSQESKRREELDKFLAEESALKSAFYGVMNKTWGSADEALKAITNAYLKAAKTSWPPAGADVIKALNAADKRINPKFPTPVFQPVAGARYVPDIGRDLQRAGFKPEVLDVMHAYYGQACEGSNTPEAFASNDPGQCIPRSDWRTFAKAANSALAVWLARLSAATQSVCLDLAAQGAASEATDGRSPVKLKTVAYTMRVPMMVSTSSAPKKSVVPIVVGAAAAGGIGWLLWSVFA